LKKVEGQVERHLKLKWYGLEEGKAQDVQLVVVREHVPQRVEHATHSPLDLTRPDVTQST
jgi:hypothetical protein